MEDFARSLRQMMKRISRFVVPHFRHLLRFLLLPYCYSFLVNWKECTASRVTVAFDLLYIFFVLRYFPDNYSACRLYEVPRSEWAYYYGSTYNPFQRAKLIEVVQPPEYQIVFEDKEVSQAVCQGHDLPVPKALGVVGVESPMVPQLEELLRNYERGEFFCKPVWGSAGMGVLLLTKQGGEVKAFGQDGEVSLPGGYMTKERFLVQERVEQHQVLAGLNPSSTNTLRLVTLMGQDGDSFPISASFRVGVKGSHIDNWSAGGISIGVNLESGQLHADGWNKKGVIHLEHPDNGQVFEGFQIPHWDAVLELTVRTQNCFPFFRLLGLDLAVTDSGPVLIEINAFPDMAAEEQNVGPFLRNRRLYDEFEKYDLFINGKQKRLYS